MHMNLETEFLGVKFHNPLVVASGILGVTLRAPLSPVRTLNTPIFHVILGTIIALPARTPISIVTRLPLPLFSGPISPRTLPGNSASTVWSRRRLNSTSIFARLPTVSVRLSRPCRQREASGVLQLTGMLHG